MPWIEMNKGDIIPFVYEMSSILSIFSVLKNIGGMSL